MLKSRKQRAFLLFIQIIIYNTSEVVHFFLLSLKSGQLYVIIRKMLSISYKKEVNVAMINGFYAMVSRMKYINRWALMRNEHSENLMEHSFEVAVIAHALTVIANKRFGKALDCERAALLGLYHDTPETLTGDLPTPIKYYSEEVRSAFKTVEDVACKSLIDMLPEDFREDYEAMFMPKDEDKDLWKYVKAADKISALIKCLEEKKAGNSEFTLALESTAESIKKLNMPEAEVFVNEFLPAYELTLDELKN